MRIQRPKPHQLIAASCHYEEEIERAIALDVDFITISPVCVTPTHPEASPLGFDRTKQLTELSSIPSFWLGGLRVDQINDIRRLGAQGIAAIRGLVGSLKGWLVLYLRIIHYCFIAFLFVKNIFDQ